MLFNRKNWKLTMTAMVAVVALMFAPPTIGADLDVPTQTYPTIQSAINAAASGDTVYVGPGTYYERIWMKDGVHLLGDGPDVTTIDAQQLGSVVTANANDARISGFTLMNSGTSGGQTTMSGIFIYGRYSPSIVDNVIKNNVVGIAVHDGANPEILNNLIIGNTQDGLYIYGEVWDPSNPIIVNNTIVNNGRGGIVLRKEVSPTVLNNVITGHVNGWPTDPINFPESWGIHYNYVTGSPVLNHNNLWNNDVNYMRNNVPDETLAGAGAISADPMFVNSDTDDYHLRADSPCIDAGTDILPEMKVIWVTDFDGNQRVRDGDADGIAVVDMGAFEAITGSTPAGENTTVQPEDPATGDTPVTLTFDDVTEGGVTTVNSTTPSAEQGAPEGFKFGNPPVMYEIATTADYTGNITICFDYSGASYGNEAKLRLFHKTEGGWVDITTSIDTESKIICGEVTSLSFFGVFESELLSPIELLQQLAAKVFGLNLQQGISNSLDAKLDAALKALEDINANNDVAAINTMEAFINAAQAQSGDKIPEPAAADLIATALEIITALSSE